MFGQLAGPTPDDVIAMASWLFSVRETDLRSHDSRRPLVKYRLATMVACRLATEYSKESIASAFDGRDQSTVLYASQRAAQDSELHRLAVLIAEEVADAQRRKMAMAG